MLPFITQPAVAPACYVPPAETDYSLLLDTNKRLSRTFANGGDRSKWTFDAVAELDASTRLFDWLSTYNSDVNPNNYAYIRVEPGNSGLSGRLTAYSWTGSAELFFGVSDQVFRSPGRYHLHVEYESANPKAAERMRIWVNGVRVAMTWTTPVPTGDQADFNSAKEHTVYSYHYNSTTWGCIGRGGRAFFVDGALVPLSDFGEANIHGVWTPKTRAQSHAAILAAGGYGVTGFALDFSDPLNPGKDVSGKGNHFTPVGFDAAGKDTVVTTFGNVFATLNPLAKDSGVTLSDGDLRTQQPSGSTGRHVSTLMVTGADVQAEVTILSLGGPSARPFGVVLPEWNPTESNYLMDGFYFEGQNGNVIFPGGVTLASGLPTVGAGDTVGMVLRPTAATLSFYKVASGGAVTDLGTYSLGTLAGRPLRFAGASGHAHAYQWNFGQRAFRNPIAGVKGLCTDNLPEPAVKDPAEAFAQAADTGLNILLVLDADTAHWNTDGWVEIIKRRDASEDWRVRFSDDPGNAWATNTANAKGAAATLATGGDYVGHRLRVGAKYGVWTAEVAHATGTATTVPHGLHTARNMVIATRVSAGGGDRYVRHPDMPAGVLGKLNSNTQLAADGTLTAFGASSFQIASTAPSGIYRVLVLAHRPGWLEIGSYQGNGNADGSYDAMGIAPLFQFIKRLDGSGAWMQSDIAHAPVNPMTKHFDLDKPDSEINAGYDLDMVVGGVKYRTAGYNSNDTSCTYLRVAIGRPVGGVCVAPATAR